MIHYLSIPQPEPMNVLYLETPLRRLNPDQYPAVYGQIANTAMRAACLEAYNYCIPFGNHVGEGCMHIFKHEPYTFAPYGAAMIFSVFCETHCCRLQVSTIHMFEN